LAAGDCRLGQTVACEGLFLRGQFFGRGDREREVNVVAGARSGFNPAVAASMAI
jgi:hypothetical protein